MKGRDRRRRAKARQRDGETRGRGDNNMGHGRQKANGLRRCLHDERMVNIPVCIVRQERDVRQCFGCQWYTE